MSYQRSPIEIQLLKEEAERRMRRGDAGADIARDLRISPSTLANWAVEGNWRKKDIAFELNEERGKALLARIAETKQREHEETLQRAAEAEALGKAAMKAMQAVDPKNDGTPPGMTPMPAHQLSLAMAHALLEQGQLGDAERAARFALRFAQAQKATNDRDAGQWRIDRERILGWWNDNHKGFISFHRQATEAIEELRSLLKFERDAREAGMCPTCTRPAEFWPAAIDEPRDAAFKKMEEIDEREREEDTGENNQDGEDPLDGSWFWRRA